MLSGLLLFRGDWAEARDQAEAAMDGYEREGGEIHPAWALRGLALVAAHDGRRDDARRWAEEGLARGDPSAATSSLATFHHHILGVPRADVGENWPDADAHLAAAADGMAQSGVRHPGRFKVAGDQVEAALALGRHRAGQGCRRAAGRGRAGGADAVGRRRGRALGGAPGRGGG